MHLGEYEKVLSKNMPFGPDADIYMVKKFDKILTACNVNQWYIW